MTSIEGEDFSDLQFLWDAKAESWVNACSPYDSECVGGDDDLCEVASVQDSTYANYEMSMRDLALSNKPCLEDLPLCDDLDDLFDHLKSLLVLREPRFRAMEVCDESTQMIMDWLSRRSGEAEVEMLDNFSGVPYYVFVYKNSINILTGQLVSRDA